MVAEKNMEYQHGGDIYSNQVDMDYSANISPLGLPKKVFQAAVSALAHCENYPDSQCRELRKALALHYHVPMEWIVCGNGAADLIFSAACSIKPKKALLPAPTFSEYGQALDAVECKKTVFRLSEKDGFSFTDKEGAVKKEFLECLQTEKYDMLFLCNPNNPTGNRMEKKAVRQIVDVCKKTGTFVVLDECFCDFLEDEEHITFVSELKDNKHVLLLRAFTKMYAMPGLRLGYGMCSDPDRIQHLNAVRQPWGVSGIAQAAGIAALKETDYVRNVKKLIFQERKVLETGLKKLGFLVYTGNVNYLLFRVPEDLLQMEQENAYIYHAMLKRKILIRDCRNYQGLTGGYYRICVKGKKENQIFLGQIEDALNEIKGNR